MANTTSGNRRSSIKVLLVAVLGAAAIGGASAFYLSTNQHKEPASSAHTVEAPIFVALEPLTVNLQSDGRSRFLHIGVTLRVADAQTQQIVNQYLPEVRSRVLLLLSNRPPETLASPEDREKLGDEILAALKRPLVPNQAPQHIASVVFNTFVLQ